MPFMDIFRNFFGIRSNEDRPTLNYGPKIIPRQENDSFRNPIWENEDDDDDGSDFREPNGGIHFQIFGDPFEMTRYFESQMDSILKNFFDGFGQRGFIVPFEEKSTLRVLPPLEPKRGTSLRDRILQREFESSGLSQDYPKLDSDLDGKISPDEFMKVWKDPSTQQVEPFNPRNSITSRFTGRATTTQVIRRNDGTLEKHQTFRDSDGNEQTTVTRQIGDKIHEIITKRDKAGVEIKTEKFINMDENELKTFNDTWKSGILPNPSTGSSDSNDFIWHKLFGLEPKL